MSSISYIATRLAPGADPRGRGCASCPPPRGSEQGRDRVDEEVAMSIEHVLRGRARACGAAGLVCVMAAGCATNPVTGRRQLSLVSEAQEIQMGQQASQEI